MNSREGAASERRLSSHGRNVRRPIQEQALATGYSSRGLNPGATGDGVTAGSRFSACSLSPIGVRVAAKAASYAKWVGIMPVTNPGESCASVFALAAALGRVLSSGH
jgi:hypothetical protein